MALNVDLHSSGEWERREVVPKQTAEIESNSLAAVEHTKDN